eukprot:6213502-Pleurochrysis_carterae.AAC.2
MTVASGGSIAQAISDMIAPKDDAFHATLKGVKRHAVRSHIRGCDEKRSALAMKTPAMAMLIACARLEGGVVDGVARHQIENRLGILKRQRLGRRA